MPKGPQPTTAGFVQVKVEKDEEKKEKDKAKKEAAAEQKRNKDALNAAKALLSGDPEKYAAPAVTGKPEGWKTKCWNGKECHTTNCKFWHPGDPPLSGTATPGKGGKGGKKGGKGKRWY